MKYPKYPKYKDCGIEWIGEIPEHWHEVRLKNVISCKITDGPHVTPDFIDEGYPFLSVDGIQDGELTFENCRYISEKEHSEFTKKAKPVFDDILIGKAASVGKIARVKVDFEFSIWSPLALVKLKKRQFDPTFVEYALKSHLVQFQIENLSTYNTQRNISMDELPNLSFPIPPRIEEQKTISINLFKILSKIDLLISKQFRIIDLLKEKRQAIITHAVTKGLDPNVPMKDSGIEWIGEIPEHWQTRRLKFVSKIQFSNVDKHSLEGEIPVKLANYVDVYKNEFITSSMDFMDATANVEEIKKFRLNVGDVLITKDSETPDDIAIPALVKSNIPNLICGYHLAQIRPKNDILDGGFLFYTYANKSFRGKYESEANGITRFGLTQDSFSDTYICFPGLIEQLSISSFLESETSKVDSLISKQQKMIELLKEHKNSLISNAVTGKIDVRGIVQEVNGSAGQTS